MPDIVSDIVDVYVFRRLNARVQFLLLQRRANVPLGNTWQSFHTQIQGHESTISAARRAVHELAGLNVSEVYSADYINEFFDDTRDMVVLAPVLAVNVNPQAPVSLGPELKECAWWDTNQAVAKLPFAGQRWAVRHINEIMSIGLAESQLYRLQLPAEQPAGVRPSIEEDAGASAIEQSEGDISSAEIEGSQVRFDREALRAGDPGPDTGDEPGDDEKVIADADDAAEPGIDFRRFRLRTDVPKRDE